ncbi:MAG TPA: AAA domain-containing protein, partial [Acidimicrobiales bacterium]|nr:AAA domain-containing protein [Acidimicrobiales bacterium]
LVGYHRQVGLGDATEALIGLEAALEDGGANDAREIRAVVAGYNEDDCRATLALRDWLEARRGDLAARLGEDLPRPQPPAEPEARERPEVVAVKEALCAGVPEDPSARTSEEAARALLADLLEWHRREAKPAWWRYFHVRTLSDAELVGEPDALGGLVGGEVVDEVMRSVVRRFSFPPQEHGFARGDTAVDPVTGRTFEVWAISNDTGIVLLKMAKSYRGPLPTALVEGRPVDTAPLAAALLELGRRVATEGVTGADAATALLGRHRPTGEGVGPGPLQGEGESATDAAVRLTLGLRGSYLPIQGPPGTGKTFTGAKQILALLDAGRSVGITGPSHAVINHMIAEVLKRASDQREATPRIGQRAEDDNPFLHPGAEGMSNEALAGALVSGEIQVGAGTAWLWSRPDLADSVDTLFVDEAGQLSLANVLAVAGAGANLVLLGDPQQLAQPSQAAHPPGVGVSALEHVLGDRATMPEAAGLFMDRTRRMHPDLCTYTSQAFYDCRLGWVEGLEHQEILGEGTLSGSGIRVVEVPHDGNANQSPEEAEAVAGIAADLLGRKWRNAKGISPLTAGDILIVTPYNAQIRAIEEVLREGGIDGVQVGTVDKFQGRQAPVVLYSMASSSAEEAPRGMEFLYDPHRLNVATSRAQALAIIVASPEVPRAQCRTPRHMQLANALCRAWELDSSTTVASSSRSRPRKVRPAREVWAERFGKK